MDIEGVLSTLESQLRELGLTEETGALLVQVNILGKSYIMSRGNLNNLSMPTLINATNEGLDFINFMENEIKLANVCDST